MRLSLGRGVGSGPRVRSGGPALVPARGRARGAGLTAGAVGRHRGPPRVVGGRVAARVDGRALRRAGVRVRAGTGLRSGRGGRGAGVRVGARGRASGSARGGWLGKKRSGTGRDGISATRDARGRTGTGICPPPVSCAGRACANAGCIAPAATRRAARSGAGGARGRAETAPASRSPREFRRIRFIVAPRVIDLRYSALSSSRRPLRCVARACGSRLASRSSRSRWRARRRLPRPRPPPPPDPLVAATTDALATHRAGDEGSALEKYERILTNAADAARLSPAAAAQLHTNAGAIRYGRGDAARARAHFERAVALDPTHADAVLNLALVLSEDVGAQRDALALARDAVRLRPDHAKSHHLLGNVLQRLGQDVEAHLRFETAETLAAGSLGAVAPAGMPRRVARRARATSKPSSWKKKKETAASTPSRRSPSRPACFSSAGSSPPRNERTSSTSRIARARWRLRAWRAPTRDRREQTPTKKLNPTRIRTRIRTVREVIV